MDLLFLRHPNATLRIKDSNLERQHHVYFGSTKRPGFMLILQSFATQPESWRYVCTPSRILMWVKPISLMNSSFACSERTGMVFVTLNIVLMMSWHE